MTGEPAASFFILLFTAALASGCLLAAFHFYRRRCLINDTPTSKTKGVFIGLAEIKGTAESDTPLTSYLAGTSCVYFRYKVEEHWRRTSLDAKGRPKTESGWKTVAEETKMVPIFLKDDTGLIRILPEGAEIHADNVFKEECRRNDPLYYDKGPTQGISHSTHRRRFTEEAIALYRPLYVVGQARERRDIVAAEIARSKDMPLYLISTKAEDHHSGRYRLWYSLWLAFGLAVSLGGLWLYNAQSLNHPSLGELLVGGAALYAVATLLGWLWNAYNSLVHLRQRVNQGWSQIEIELKRRHDLIPSLLRAVEAYRSHESGLQQLVTELRRETSDTAGGSSFSSPKFVPQFAGCFGKVSGLKG
ncbi:MAG: GIDE domain-containing protein [Dehalogenimonas sp.]|uniref:RING-type E3 ubiquitin transferase n=1 Tax=Candidatus Dehalogenimonas loeffleri TaxID=3127115 RepID=A0ABZ2J5P2_9CHLR|nr:GIDE domain-containing protein [Dehalogenimonas sp.]